MKIEEAIDIIKDSESTFERCVEAAGVLTQSDATPLKYLVECLKRRGLPAEIAAMRLYKITKRTPPNTPYEFIADYENWTHYLAKNKFTV